MPPCPSPSEQPLVSAEHAESEVISPTSRVTQLSSDLLATAHQLRRQRLFDAQDVETHESQLGLPYDRIFNIYSALKSRHRGQLTLSHCAWLEIRP